jgi:hypothetical protein
MWHAIRNVGLAALVVVASPFHASAQAPARLITTSDAPVLTPDAVLHAGLRRIFRGSPTWREAMDAVRKTGRRALVVTPDDPILESVRSGKDRDRFDSGAMGEVVPAVDGASQVSLVLVIVNVPVVKRLHDAQMSPRRDFEADLDRILVHEIYGHAIPYLLAGSLSGRCPDPRDGERATDACSIRRENVVRAQLGLGVRTDSGLSSLSLARGGVSVTRGRF